MPPMRYTIDYDLTNCDAEPLRFIRSCQHGAVLLVLYADSLRIKGASENCHELFGRSAKDLLGEDAGAVLGSESMDLIRQASAASSFDTVNPFEHYHRSTDGSVRKNLVVNQEGELLILEFEDRDEQFGTTAFLMQVDRSLARIQSFSGSDVAELHATTVQEVRRLTGYDRVYLYEFDKEYNGKVVAEARREGMESFLHLHYPHTDIPKQARELYLRQQVRMVTSTVADCDSLLITDDRTPIDLSTAGNRGVSPIHLEYLRNMGVGASLSIAVTVNGKLWGLLACHHEAPRSIDFRLRKLLGLFGRILSGHLALHQTASFRNNVLSTSLLRARLVDRLIEAQDIVTPIQENEEMLLSLMKADGAALLIEDHILRIGSCPEEKELSLLLGFLEQQPSNIFSTASLYRLYAPAKNFSTAPAGLLSIRISKEPAEHLVWFRPETIRELAWGGRPEQRKEIVDGKVRLHPHLSFAKYVQTTSGEARPWAQHHLDNALALRNDIKEVILVKYQEMRHLNNKLVSAYEELQSFSYTVSHDLRAPLRGIKGYAKILQEDYSDRLDDFGQSALRTIVSSVDRMNTFINGILEFSRIGSGRLRVEAIHLPTLLDEVWQSSHIQQDVALNKHLDVEYVIGDHTLLWQLFQNFLSNSVKYRREEVASYITVRTRQLDEGVSIEIEDNGIGFDVKHAGSIFTPFTRLVSEEEYEGSGIGLAIAQRIVQKHYGDIDVDSKPNVGTTFEIRLPGNLQELVEQDNQQNA